MKGLMFLQSANVTTLTCFSQAKCQHVLKMYHALLFQLKVVLKRALAINVHFRAHWGENPYFIQKFTFLKSQFLNKNRIFKITFFAKITFQKPIFHKNRIFKITCFFQKSHFQNLISHISHNLEADFSQKSHFQNFIFHRSHIISNI